MPENQSQDYTVFGGWLLVWYWCLIVGGVLTLLSMAIPALFSIAASFLVGIIYAVGLLISIASVCVTAALNIKAATELKARKPQFFDTILRSTVISFCGGVLASLFQIRSAYGVGGFISSTIGSIIGTALGLCICIMYFSKSVRVNVYFGGRPLQSSQYWDWIKILPTFIISEAMPDSSKIQQQISSYTQPTGQKPQETEQKPQETDQKD